MAQNLFRIINVVAVQLMILLLFGFSAANAPDMITRIIVACFLGLFEVWFLFNVLCDVMVKRPNIIDEDN